MTSSREWLETDGLGGFATGTVDGIRSRRYHGLLVAAATPPTGRMMLVNGFEASVRTQAGRFPLTAQRYEPDVVHPTEAPALESFETEPWPAWVFRLPDGARIRQEIVMRRGAPVTVVTWRLETPGSATLFVRPLMSGRDYHALHHENGAFRFDPESRNGRHTWRPYDGVPGVTIAGGRYRHDPVWYRRFLYEEERARGFDAVEDLASPGVFELDLGKGDAAWILSAEVAGTAALPAGAAPERLAADLRDAERERRRAFALPLHRAADCYLVRRGEGSTIIAGYPWFTDWGRDTFIAVRGLCLTTGRLDEARRILLAWAGTVSEGMVPNRFPDAGAEPEYNSVDASLWYVIAVGELLEADRGGSANENRALRAAVLEILSGYRRGTRYGIKADTDGLLAAGEPGQQLTWMDARSDGREVTPRIGKPVEVQALWLNALAVGARWSKTFGKVAAEGRRSFEQRFWSSRFGYLCDIVDFDHRPGTSDAVLRPNQILAVGGLPHALLEGKRARAVVDVVEQKLWTPLGLRTLDPGSENYRPRYEGGPSQRDAAYHQGTVWPWLAGPFVEAWLRVHGDHDESRQSARRRFVEPLLAHLREAGLGHVSEIADAEPPHAPRGCPFQAWSLGELLRIEAMTREHRQPRAPRAQAVGA